MNEDLCPLQVVKEDNLFVYTLQHGNFRPTGLAIQLIGKKNICYQVRLGKNENCEKCQKSEDKWTRSVAMMEIAASMKEALAEGKIYNARQAVQAYKVQK